MIVFMYRPSPQIPNPSFHAAQQCYSAAVFNIQLQKRQVEAHLIDITWIFTQAIFMALNTVLWCLSYPGIRQQHPLEEVQLHIQDALKAIDLCADRWPGVRSAQQLYENLVLGCLKAYEADTKVSELSPASQSDHVSPSTQDISSSTSQFANSPASTTSTSIYGPQSPQSIHSIHAATGANHPFKNAAPGYIDHAQQGAYQPGTTYTRPGVVPTTTQPLSNQQYLATSLPRLDAQSLHYSLPGFDPHHANSYLPTSSASASSGPWTTAPMIPGIIPGITGSPNMNYDNLPYLASFGQEYSRYMGQTFPPTGSGQPASGPGGAGQGAGGGGPPYLMQTLSSQQQMELMAILESEQSNGQLPDVSGLVSDATTFYTAQLP